MPLNFGGSPPREKSASIFGSDLAATFASLRHEDDVEVAWREIA
jgi:hypothetical protein